MGIKLNNADSMPAVTYDKIHLSRLEITQPTQTADAEAPKYSVIINYRHYGVVDGVRYYKLEDVQRVAIEDFLQLAMTDYAAGDPTLLQALGSIELAVAGIISDQTGAQTSVV